jgi:hypothetical protein
VVPAHSVEKVVQELVSSTGEIRKGQHQEGMPSAVIQGRRPAAGCILVPMVFCVTRDGLYEHSFVESSIAAVELEDVLLELSFLDIDAQQ